MLKLYFILVFLILYDVSETAKILCVFPVPSISHQVVFRHITQELARRGHEVTVVTPDPAFPKGQAPGNLTEIDVHGVSYNNLSTLQEKYPVGSPDNFFSSIDVMFYGVFKIFENQLKTIEVSNLLTQKFDLLLVEALITPTLVLSHILKVPVIQVSSFGPAVGFDNIVGAPHHPLLYPMFIQQKLFDQSILEKFRELYINYLTHKYFYVAEEAFSDIFRNMFGADVPTISELKSKVDLVLLNVHPIWENNRPVPPNVVYIGGIHTQPNKELSKDVKSYLDASTNGAIYVSFGTNIFPSLLPPEKMNILRKVFSELPYNVLWKWDQEDMPGKPDNVRVSKWLPQADLLKHPNIKLFVTHGGLQSTDEAINAGVPLVGIPMLGDQWYNVEMYVRHKIGLKIDLHILEKEKLRIAIDTVINEASYRQNIQRLRLLIHDSPQKPLDRAIWWIEHILRHGGGAHLRSPAANMSWTQYFELELILILLVVLITSFTVILLGLYIIYMCVRRNFKASVKHKKT